MDSRLAQSLLKLALTQGLDRIGRTVFVKYLYLLDVLVAEYQGGEKYTPWPWKFVHFGPYAGAAVDLIEADEQIERHEYQRESGETATIYKLRGSMAERVPDLQELGLSIGVKSALSQLMNRHGSDLGSLLDYVYFQTEPMKNAKPGQVLDFCNCRRMTIDEVRPIAFPQPSEDVKKRAKERIRLAREERLARLAHEPVGVLDDVYYQGLMLLENTPVPVGVTGVARMEDDLNGDTESH